MALQVPITHPAFKADPSSIIQSNAIRQGIRPAHDELFRTEDERLYFTDEYIEKLSDELEYVAENDPLLFTLSAYFRMKKISRISWQDILPNRSVRFQEAKEFARNAIGERREQATWLSHFPVANMLRVAAQFVTEYSDESIRQANLSAQAKIAAESELLKKEFIFTEKIIRNGEEMQKITTVKPREKIDAVE